MVRHLLELDEDGAERSRCHLLHLDEEPLPTSIAVELLLDLPQDGGHQEQGEEATAKIQDKAWKITNHDGLTLRM